MADDLIRVTLLGTGSPPPRMDRFGPSTLIEVGEQKFLFDCGRGAAQRLQQIGIPFTQLDRLLLTHLHSDHLVGIPDLWLSGWIFGRATPFRVWGPEGAQSLMHHLEQAFQADIHIRRDLDERFPAEGIETPTVEFEEGVVYEEAGVKITAFNVDHRPVEPAFGFRIEHAGRTVVLSGDTTYAENLVRFAHGADLLVHEVCAPEAMRKQSFRSAETTQRIIDHHTTPEQAGRLFSAIRPRLAVFSHIVGPSNCEDELLAGTRAAYDGPFEVGHDLMTIEVGEEVTVHSAAP
jgi:ribonuclease Z